MSYRKWISVTLEHGYFADGKCPGLRFEPTEDSRKQLGRDKQFFYPLPRGYLILADTANIKEDRNAGDGVKNRCFDTAVYCADMLFGNYSNLEIDYRKGKVYYIGSTLKTGPDQNPGTREKRVTLSDPQGGLEIEAVPVLLKPKQLVISLENAAPGDTFRVLDRNNSVLAERQVKDTGSKAALYLDAGNKDTGIYYLEKNDVIAAYFYADDLLYRSKPVFIIGIDAAGRDYNIRVANRPVSWQYHVIARSNGRKLKDLEIRNNNKELLPGVSFPQVRLDEAGNEAVFESDKPVPLWEKAYQSIELIEKGNGGTPLVSHLANAGISSLHVKDGKWEARIYVYI